MRTTRNMLYASRQYTNRQLHEVLPDGAWRGKPCFIIGGGPSLQNFDWSLLRGKRTIGINRAFERLDPTIIFSMDTRFLNWLVKGMYDKRADGAGAREKFNRSTAYKVWLATYRLSLPPEFFIVKVKGNYNQGLRNFGTSLEDGIGHGNNSGYAALNLAVCLGADPVYLLGFDCNHDHKFGRTHWHSGHPMPQKFKTVKDFIAYFNRAAMRISHTKSRVINLNPESALQCFPKQRPEEVLH